LGKKLTEHGAFDVVKRGVGYIRCTEAGALSQNFILIIFLLLNFVVLLVFIPGDFWVFVASSATSFSPLPRLSWF
jgi:hypothetical protein